MKSFLAGACGITASFVVTSANAGDCARPTDPAGFNGYAYPEGAVRSFDGRDVRVWYTQSGKHAVFAAIGSDGIPTDVARVAEVGDQALEAYAAKGFRKPPSDLDDPECGDNGGDGRLDVYLVDFNAADGQTVPDRCAPTGFANGYTCASFLLVKANFAGLYATRDEGIRTVVPHELFHAVQNAYDVNMDRFWSEGTAQWATKMLDPTVDDLERFLPAYFRSPERSFDAPAGGATAGFLYGSAIWPVFLAERHHEPTILEIFTEIAESGASTLPATASVLARKNTNLGSEFATFAAWNAATGRRSRADATATAVAREGYANATSYPEVALAPWPADTIFRGSLSGLGATYARWPGGDRKRLTLEGDATRLTATVIPLENGIPALEKRATLPADIEGEAIVVVSATTTKKSDAVFAVRAGAPRISMPPPDSTTVVDETAPAPPSTGRETRFLRGGDSGGCHASGASNGGRSATPGETRGEWILGFLMAVGTLALVRSRKLLRVGGAA